MHLPSNFSDQNFNWEAFGEHLVQTWSQEGGRKGEGEESTEGRERGGGGKLGGEEEEKGKRGEREGKEKEKKGKEEREMTMLSDNIR